MGVQRPVANRWSILSGYTSASTVSYIGLIPTFQGALAPSSSHSLMFKENLLTIFLHKYLLYFNGLSSELFQYVLRVFRVLTKVLGSSLTVRLTDEGRAETKDQARTRANDYRERRSNDSRLNSRKHQKFVRWRDGVKLVLQESELLSLSNLDRAKYQRAKDVLDKLGVEGQSSEEESDSEPGVLKVTVPHYQRRVVTEMMKDLDLRVKEVTDSVARQSGKRILPRPTHIRQRIERKSERTVRKGLPRSLYHHRFLARLPVAVLEDLKIDNQEITGFDQWALAMQADSDSDEDI
ncbi:hypothetical protein DFJ43DRAFT_1152799 [Lentinula guzmanii]|uniref:Uncharacterized protein n=1 Tax=Lentinula guzmanii TaxID=2804957 RepID=A0AA38N358_9AGAR|nr:hypothetical protein DFJ43DRAFT_1152799 [Lentinula guzmanii]